MTKIEASEFSNFLNVLKNHIYITFNKKEFNKNPLSFFYVKKKKIRKNNKIYYLLKTNDEFIEELQLTNFRSYINFNIFNNNIFNNNIFKNKYIYSIEIIIIIMFDNSNTETFVNFYDTSYFLNIDSNKINTINDQNIINIFEIDDRFNESPNIFLNNFSNNFSNISYNTNSKTSNNKPTKLTIHNKIEKNDKIIYILKLNQDVSTGHVYYINQTKDNFKFYYIFLYRNNEKKKYIYRY